MTICHSPGPYYSASDTDWQTAAIDPGPALTGSEALALGALEAGVQFVTGYPGSPATATVDALLRMSAPDGPPHIEWAINEKSAADAALGFSLAGGRALLCLKNVGLNVALDALMVANLAPGDGGLVVLVGDDPGGWGSQNEEDSRPLAAAAELPLLEPSGVAEARAMVREAFDLAERVGLPVVVRFIRALAADRGPVAGPPPAPPARRAGAVERQPGRWTVLPIQVVDLHTRLQEKVARARREFETSPLNVIEGSGRFGVIAAGQVYQKLAEVLAGIAGEPPPLRVLRLGTLHPLPEQRLAAFLGGLERVLVLEETAPYIETAVQAAAQRAGLTLPILGRASGHVPGAGELFGDEIAAALEALLPGRPWPRGGQGGRTRPSRQALCDGCPYLPVVEALLAVMERHGGRDAFLITGETGCLVRAQLPPWELLDIKYSMGSSIGIAAGLARAGIAQRVVALSGDSAFLHNGLGELIDAAQAGLPVVIILLDNGTTALSGGQPHPASGHDARGRPRRAVDLAALVRAAGVDHLHVVEPVERAAVEAALASALAAAAPAVVVARQPCPLWAARE